MSSIYFFVCHLESKKIASEIAISQSPSSMKEKQRNQKNMGEH